MFLDAQQAIFNPNCTTKNLLDDIKRRCQCETDGKKYIFQNVKKYYLDKYYLCLYVVWHMTKVK